LGKLGRRAIPVAKDGLIVRLPFFTSFKNILVTDVESIMAEKIGGIKGEENAGSNCRFQKTPSDASRTMFGIQRLEI
jgi:hypothetical protein